LKPTRVAEPLSAALLGELRQLFRRDALLTEPADCWAYGYDNSRRQAMPQAVLLADSTTQVAALVRLCNQHRIALTPRGRGTGTAGGTVPVRSGLVLSLERMCGRLEIDPDNRIAEVSAGILNQELQDRAAGFGFFWPPDPTSAAACTVGGNLACNAAGPRAVKYGTPRENTLGLRAISGAGQELQTGVRTTKGVVGYDMTRLLIGSEGTLAIITEATLKLTPLAEAKRTLRALYRDIGSAAEAVSAIMRQTPIPCALEIMDGAAIRMVRHHVDLGLPPEVNALLMIEVDGDADCIQTAARKLANSASNSGTIEVQIAEQDHEIDKLWAARKALSPALRTIAPVKINEDVVVPVSNIPDLILGLERLSRDFQLPIVNFGHAGNGNIHVNIMVDPAQPGQSEAATACLDQVFALVLALGGTLSGEHGIGLVKRDFVSREIDPVTLELMWGIKRQFDPLGLLNPEKSIPAV
jgi:D-lactate dehydrogenase